MLTIVHSSCVITGLIASIGKVPKTVSCLIWGRFQLVFCLPGVYMYIPAIWLTLGVWNDIKITANTLHILYMTQRAGLGSAHLSRLHSLTAPSCEHDARLMVDVDWPIVDCGWNTTAPTLMLWPKHVRAAPISGPFTLASSTCTCIHVCTCTCKTH